MPTATTANIRKKIARNRERDFVRYHEFEAVRERQPRLISAEALFDPLEIERQAKQLLEAHTAKEVILPPQEYLDNARTALFEALTASGHLSRVELHGTPEEVNAQVLNRLLNGLSRHLPPHEQSRRFQEICEELCIQRVQALIEQGELPPDTEVLTISDYPNVLSNEAALAVGYNPYNKKGMVRANSFTFHSAQLIRVIEQISRGNADDPEASILFLQQHAVPVRRTNTADIDLLGTQALYRRYDFAQGVVDIQRRLDAFSARPVMYGETPRADTIGYEELRTISALRESRVESFAKELAAHEELLDKKVINGNLTPAESAEKYITKVRELVRQICVLNPRFAKDALGDKVAVSYEAAAERLRAGDSQGASAIVAANAGNERAVVVCGLSVGPEAMSATQQREFATALQQKQELWRLRPKHANDSDYLRRKYKLKAVPIGICQACDKRKYVAQCRICPGCDWEDTKQPGYIEQVLRRKSRSSWSTIIDDWHEARRREREVARAEKRAKRLGQLAGVGARAS